MRAFFPRDQTGPALIRRGESHGRGLMLGQRRSQFACNELPIDPDKFNSRRRFQYAEPMSMVAFLTFVKAIAIVCRFMLAVMFFSWSLDRYDAARDGLIGRTFALRPAQ